MVDKHDQIIGKATRREIHEMNLMHRSIHIFVFNSYNQIFLQKRSNSKDENPGYWDTSAAGHVDSGETYDECAKRELWEELRIKDSLQYFKKIHACKETYNEHVQVYLCKTNASIVINKEEISEGKFFDWFALPNLLKNSTEKFTSSFRFILYKYYQTISNQHLN